MAVTRTYRVWGLTCGACLVVVLDAVRSLPGVRSAAVDLVREGGSRLVITATREPQVETIRAAVELGGFVLGRSRAGRAGSGSSPGTGTVNGQPALTANGPVATMVPDAAYA
ncbi:heavy-metal-associated domain-containing protein [Ornithinimicrobium sp. Y1694]|uniref:heavy-metal-associated domain-containing protein n=1 Tax=Ornithinimicrobium sp. Y1694 TaxID=3418590 RepID=UPI003CF6AC00